MTGAVRTSVPWGSSRTTTRNVAHHENDSPRRWWRPLAVRRPTPGIDSSVVHAGDCRANAVNSRSSSDRTVAEPALELRAREALLLDDPPAAVSVRQLEHGLREIHTHDGQSSGS